MAEAKVLEGEGVSIREQRHSFVTKKEADLMRSLRFQSVNNDIHL
ncbi:MAG: hypothetical protein FD122_3256 [Stygiobacter sp.]|nr:MAG: hypothetical protein FD122_3256 [Stygiobacter sp.]KAF0215417.1 MAG: hypothetical protein FD178_1701 [Ignavibacteria bacterium]